MKQRDIMREKKEKRIYGFLPSDKPLPYDENLERAVLGAILADEDAAETAMEKFSEDNVFYFPRHRTIFEEIRELMKKDAPVEPVNLCGGLREKGVLDEIGGEEYIVQLQHSVATTAHIESWCIKLRAKAIQRELIKALSITIDKCYDPEASPESLAGEIELEFLKAQRLDSGNAIRCLGEVIKNEAFPYIDKILRKEKPENIIETHFSDLDRFLGGGMREGEMYVLAARPGVGKTSFAINILTQTALSAAKVPVVFFSMEMTAAEIARRMLYTEAQVSRKEILDPSLNNETRNRFKTKITGAASTFGKVPIFIDPTPALKVMDMRARIKKLIREHGVKFVVIDYLQLMRSEEQSSADVRQIEVSLISGGIKAMAKDLKVPILVVAQLNRQTEQQKGGRPKLSNLRESGAIEQDADVVMFLHRDTDKQKTATIEEELNGFEAELIIEKNRNGEPGYVPLLFFPRITQFTQARRISKDDQPKRN
jgi:replicative DNA helicase